MKALVFEPFSGASGDMILGSLLDLGVEESKIADAIAVFDLKLEVHAVNKRGIAAKKVELLCKAHEDKGRAGKVQLYTDTVRRLEQSGLRNEIIQHSLSIFDRIADAEATVHGVEKEHVTFHELGALDTLGDVVGSVVALLDLRPDIILSTPISVGSGFVEAAHGLH
ncbi:MAG: DUF111 family protein [Methanophagales archaeon ANME-1-THS]|nr:MAG: DUF111 family protein [Methanophagales archaeon ANME-1-THS]